MAKIEVGRWSDQLRRMLGMAGTSVVAAELSPEISPTIQLEGPGAEWNFLKGVRDCGGGGQLGAGAGFVSKWRFRNPAGSGVIIVIEVIALTPVATANLAIRGNAQTVNFTQLLLPSVMDARWGPIGSARPSLILSEDNTVAAVPAGEEMGRVSRSANGEWLYDREIVLVPGSNIDAGTETQNVGCRMWARWRERGLPVLESEPNA